MDTIEIKREFARLASQLSPENLWCDGELTRAQVNEKLANIKKRWKELETMLGRAVSEDDVWNGTI